MTPGDNSAYRLSSQALDFGIISPADRPRRTLTIAARVPGQFQARISDLPFWLTGRMAQAGNGKLSIELCADPGRLPGAGRHSAVLSLEVAGETRPINVQITLAGVKRQGQATESVPQAPATPAPEARQPERINAALSGASGRAAASMTVTGVVLLLIFSPVYQISMAILTGTSGAAVWACLITGGVALLYAGGAAIAAMPPRQRLVDPRTRNPEQRRLMDALAEVCAQAGLPSPRVVIRPAPSPNLVSRGVSPKLCCLYVNQGLLHHVQEPKALHGVLAHEMAHIRRYDNLFMAVLGPSLKLIRFGTGLAALPLFMMRNVGRRGPSPFALMMGMSALGRLGPMGLFMAMIIVAVAVAMLAIAATYAAIGLGAMAGGVACCLVYAQYLEKEADLEAARILGGGDPVLIALAQTVDHFPTEQRYVSEFAARHLPSSQDYSLADIVGALKNGARPLGKVHWTDRYFRTHPLAIERMSNLVKTFGSQLA